MTEKTQANQGSARRAPRQARSQLKVELMLEAAMQLIETGSVAALTTNAVAAKAGVSIGTLYQYFGDKQALLDALVAREMGNTSDKVLQAVQAPLDGTPGERIRAVLRAVLKSYGGRRRVHRQLMEHALTHLPGRRMSPLYAQLIALLSTQGVASPGQTLRALTAAQAFVLTHAMAGVLRTLAASDKAPPLQEVEDALVHLVLGYMAQLQPA
jgi:AcrR family transcriptional regulator